MKVLYLTEDYVGSRVHHNLCRSIVEADNQMDITLFAFNRPNYPLRDLRDTYTDINYHLIESDFDGNILMYRALFPYKIGCKYRRLPANTKSQCRKYQPDHCQHLVFRWCGGLQAMARTRNPIHSGCSRHRCEFILAPYASPVSHWPTNSCQRKKGGFHFAYTSKDI